MSTVFGLVNRDFHLIFAKHVWIRMRRGSGGAFHFLYPRGVAFLTRYS